MTPSRIALSAIALGLTCASWLGCSSDAGPPARIAVFSQVGNGKHTQDECKLGSFLDWVIVGKVGDNNIPGSATVPVNSGDAWEGHTVNATACNVTTDG